MTRKPLHRKSTSSRASENKARIADAHPTASATWVDLINSIRTHGVTKDGMTKVAESAPVEHIGLLQMIATYLPRGAEFDEIRSVVNARAKSRSKGRRVEFKIKTGE